MLLHDLIDCVQSKLHSIYIEYLLNPFNEVGDAKIISTHFDDAISSTVGSFSHEM
jgi:hypothetical protein